MISLVFQKALKSFSYLCLILGINCRPTQKAYNILLHSFALSGMVEQARIVFKSMRRDRYSLSLSLSRDPHLPGHHPILHLLLHHHFSLLLLFTFPFCISAVLSLWHFIFGLNHLPLMAFRYELKEHVGEGTRSCG